MKAKTYAYNLEIVDGQEYVDEKYPVIKFNDVFLPLGASFIDYCASSNMFHDIDDELSLWFWKFTNCIGANLSEKSSDIIKNAEKLKSLLVDSEDDVKRKIRDRYTGIETDDIFNWWLDTLDIMIVSSNVTTDSKWYGMPTKK